MKLGAEPKKMLTFVGLLAVAAIVYWMNSSSDAPSAPATPRAAADPAAVVSSAPGGVGKVVLRRMPQGHVDGLGAWEPKLPKSIDPSKVDPTLRLELLAKVQAVPEEGGVRNIFLIGQPPPIPLATANGAVPGVPKINPNAPPPPPATTAASVPKPAGPPPTPPPPPISLKYFGYSTQRSDGERKAFFLDGEDIIVAAEGEIIVSASKRQYKVVRIKENSVQMEDTASKSTQTLPLQAGPASA